MKDLLIAIGGAVILGIGVFLIVIFSSQVLLFLEGIVGIAAGVAGGVILAIGASGVKSNLEEKRAKKAEAAKADSSSKNKKE